AQFHRNKWSGLKTGKKSGRPKKYSDVFRDQLSDDLKLPPYEFQYILPNWNTNLLIHHSKVMYGIDLKKSIAYEIMKLEIEKDENIPNEMTELKKRIEGDKDKKGDDRIWLIGRQKIGEYPIKLIKRIFYLYYAVPFGSTPFEYRDSLVMVTCP